MRHIVDIPNTFIRTDDLDSGGEGQAPPQILDDDAVRAVIWFFQNLDDEYLDLIHVEP